MSYTLGRNQGISQRFGCSCQNIATLEHIFRSCCSILCNLSNYSSGSFHFDRMCYNHKDKVGKFELNYLRTFSTGMRLGNSILSLNSIRKYIQSKYPEKSMLNNRRGKVCPPVLDYHSIQLMVDTDLIGQIPFYSHW